MARADLHLSVHQPHEQAESPFGAQLLGAVANLVLESTTEGIWLIDAAERTTFVNAKMAQLLGYSVEAMVGQHLFTFMDAEGRALCERNLERRKSGVQELHEFKLLKKDGGHLWVLMATNPVYDRSGNYAGALGLIADLSVQKQRELQLTAELADLRERVATQESELLTFRERAPEWENAAATDWLTGLYNRRHFEHCLTKEIDRYQLRVGRFCVLLIDVDGFEAFDEQFGGDVGDDVLRAIGRAFDGQAEHFLRSTDIAARYSSDRFAILAVDTNLEGGTKLGERILARVAALEIATAGGHVLRLTASVGVAAFPTQARSLQPLITSAEQALRFAKHGGGARCCVGDALSERG